MSEGLSYFLSFLAAAIPAGMPLLYGTLGEILTEKGGNQNLGVEGMMYMGAIFGFVAGYYADSVLVMLLLAFAGGALGALIYAVLFLLAWEGWNLFRTLRYETELDNIPGLLLSTITLVLIGSQIYYQQKVLKGSEEGKVYTRSLTRTLILGCLLGVGLAVVGTWLMLR